jgi:hypothetical protein
VRVVPLGYRIAIVLGSASESPRRQAGVKRGPQKDQALHFRIVDGEEGFAIIILEADTDYLTGMNYANLTHRREQD